MIKVLILLGISIILGILYLTVISRFCQGKAMEIFGVHGAHIFRMICFFIILGFMWISIMIWYKWIMGGYHV